MNVTVNLTHESLDKISSMRCEQTTLVWCEQNVQLKNRMTSVTSATPLMHLVLGDAQHSRLRPLHRYVLRCVNPGP